MREDALKEAQDEPDFDIDLFNTVYPPIVDTDEESEVIPNICIYFLILLHHNDIINVHSFPDGGGKQIQTCQPGL